MGDSLAWRLDNVHITMNMFQNRCSFLYNSSAFLPWFFYVARSQRFILKLHRLKHFHFFMTWPHLIIQKENGNAEKVIYFAFSHIILIRKGFFTSTYFSPFDLKSLLSHKLSSLKAKFCFCDWLINVSIFSIIIRLQFPPNR